MCIQIVNHVALEIFLWGKMKNDYVEIKRNHIFHYWKRFLTKIQQMSISLQPQEAWKSEIPEDVPNSGFRPLKFRMKVTVCLKYQKKLHSSYLPLIQVGRASPTRLPKTSCGLSLSFEVSANYLDCTVSPPHQELRILLHSWTTVPTQIRPKLFFVPWEMKAFSNLLHQNWTLFLPLPIFCHWSKIITDLLFYVFYFVTHLSIIQGCPL